MSDDTDAGPSKAELIERVEQLESEQQTLKSQLKRMLPSRRDALKAGAGAAATVGGISLASDTAESATGSAGTIGSSSSRPDGFFDDLNANSFTGQAGGGGVLTKTRAFLSSDSSASPIPYDSVSYDADSNFDTSANEYVVPDTGDYQIHVGARAKGSQSGKFAINVTVNGSVRIRAESTYSGDNPSINLSDVLELSANDTVQVTNRQNKTLFGTNGNTYLTVVRVG